ncbi:major facilitator superfamily domain-containing protein [Hypoxylon trugodes]|uniref:major facilitator superfamily domain-containing protein n=1 Tax=Hypoxylon trugodes TaxID=326681 RepID=UPI0021916558|nr:major facilitator superfamily domain-containing protein [Hypoxylon trugodes]KAI1385126.1 major facilitator superfamily domain-containing protein [Hypoxylon trugodes]
MPNTLGDTSKPNPKVEENVLDTSSQTWLGRIHPYFKDPGHVITLKLDAFLLTWAFVAGLLKDMDQSATTQAYVSGMKESLSLYGNELVEFTTYFSVGYALFIVPAQLIQTRIRPSIFLPICEIIWGALTLATYKAPNAKTVYGLRFFLGVFESTSWPGLVSLIFNWYTPRELGKRLAIFGVSGVAGNMFLGILQAAFYKNLNGVNGLEGWQWLFIVSGIITMVWGSIGFLVIPDSPQITRAIYLSPSERELARSRLLEHGVNTSELIPFSTLVEKLRLLLKSPLTYLFLTAYLQFAWSQRANSYFLLYLKGVTNSTGEPLYSTYTVNLIPLGGYAISIVCNIALNALSDWKGWRWQISCGAATLQLLATSVLAGWPNSHPTIMTFYFLTFATAAWGYALIAWLAEILRKEPEGRSIIVAIAITLVYVGHATIPLRVWQVSDSPKYPIGFPMSAAFCVGSIIAMLSIRFYVQKNPSILDSGLAWKAQDNITEGPSDSDNSARKGG